jgi:hypothetical protein
MVAMRCDDIRDRFVELLYDEIGTPSAGPELRAHIRSCPSCRQQLDELKGVQGSLREWQDEPLPRPIDVSEIVRTNRVRAPRFDFGFWALARYAALAAVVLLAFFAGLTYESMSGNASRRSEIYTKAEVRELVRRALEDTEIRVNETTNLKLQKMLDTVENEQGYIYSRLTRYQSERLRNKN